MNHSVRGFDVSGHDVCVVDGYGSHAFVNGHFCPVDCRYRNVTGSYQIGAHNRSGNYVVGENGGEGFCVGEEVLSAYTESCQRICESLLSWSKDSERSFAFQSVDEASGL